MTEEVDAGDILAQQEYELAPNETTDSLLIRLNKIGAELIVGLLPNLAHSRSVSRLHPRGEVETKPGEHPGGEKGLSKPETEPSNRRIVGDVDFDNVSKIVQAITPVPGGIGPMTVASLFENLLEAYKRQT